MKMGRNRRVSTAILIDRSVNVWQSSPLTKVAAIGLSIAVLILAVAGASRADAGDPSSGEAFAVPVRVAKVTARPPAAGAEERMQRLRATGTLEAGREASLAFAVGGVVVDLARDEGDAVRAGDILGRVDPVPFEGEVERAEARVAFLEKSLARSAKLHAQSALTDEEFDSQEAELAEARARRKLARWNLERSVLRAPFAARVLSRPVEEGEVLAAGTPAFVLTDLSTLELRAALAAADLADVAPEGEVIVTADAAPRLRTIGRIDHAPLESDVRSGTVPLLVRVPNEDGTLLPGMVATALFSPRTPNPANDDALYVPVSALRVDDEGGAVWRVVDGRASLVPVQIIAVRGPMAAVAGELAAGDSVIDAAPDRLRTGDAVFVASRSGEMAR